MSKTSVIGIVVAVVGLFALGGFLLWQNVSNQVTHTPLPPAPAPSPQPQATDTEDFTLSEVEGWQTYRNDEFEFELKYPQELGGRKDTWLLSSTSNTSGIRFKLPTQKETEAGFPYVFLACPDGGCVVFDGEERCTLFPEIPNTVEEIAGVLFQRGVWEEEFLEPGRTWLKVEYMGKRGGTCYNFIYQVTQQEPREQIEAYISQFENIVSTFRFVDKESEVSKSLCQKVGSSVENAQPISFDADSVQETYILCSGNPKYIYVLDGEESGVILWERNLDLGEIKALESTSDPQIIDIDGDGIHEIYWVGSDRGGTCSCYTDIKALYSSIVDELFTVTEGGCFDSQCKEVVANPPTFSTNLKKEEYSFFKDYLTNKK